MKNVICIFFLIFCSVRSNSQDQMGSYPRVDNRISATKDSLKDLTSISNFINKNFEHEELKCRAVFKWIAKNIEYKMDSVYNFDDRKSRSDVINEALASKKALCNGYTFLFDTLCKLCGIQTMIIPGIAKWATSPGPSVDWMSGISTMASNQNNPQNLAGLGNIKKRQKGGIASHLWNAVKISGHWYIVDPTWGSGYINGRYYIPQTNELYFLAKGKEIVKTHHAVDPMWQLAESPVSLQQFYDPKFTYSSHEPKWSYEDTVNDWIKSEPVKRSIDLMRRLKENGLQNEYLNRYYELTDKNIQSEQNRKFREAVSYYNASVNRLNNYLDLKNKKFKPLKTDQEIKGLLEGLDSESLKTDRVYGEIKYVSDPQLKAAIEQNVKNNSLLRNKINEEIAFVNLYLSTSKSKRPSLFGKEKFEAPLSNQ